jgi:hypothetical protein
MKLAGTTQLVDQLSDRSDSMERFLLCSMSGHNRRFDEVIFTHLIQFSNGEYGFVSSRGDLVLINNVIRFVHYLQTNHFCGKEKGRGFTILYYGPNGVDGFNEERQALLDSYGHHGLKLSREILKAISI